MQQSLFIENIYIYIYCQYNFLQYLKTFHRKSAGWKEETVIRRQRLFCVYFEPIINLCHKSPPIHVSYSNECHHISNIATKCCI